MDRCRCGEVPFLNTLSLTLGTVWWVECRACKDKTMHYTSSTEAINQWNKHVNPAVTLASIRFKCLKCNCNLSEVKEIAGWRVHKCLKCKSERKFLLTSSS